MNKRFGKHTIIPAILLSMEITADLKRNIGDLDQAVSASKQENALCLENGVDRKQAFFLALTAEELTMNSMSMKKKEVSLKTGRGYIIALSKWRSRLALIASLITVFCSLYAIAGGMLIYANNGWEIGDLFHFFTINSNILTAFSACLIIPFAVEGVRKKYFSYPKWIAMLHYCGMVCTTLTMVFSVGILGWVDPNAAFGGYNLYLHIICPIMVILSFFLVESGFHYSWKNAVIAVIPALFYEAIYAYEVSFVGAENGGWEDFYHMVEFAPLAVSAVAVSLLAIGIALMIRWLYNKMTALRMRRLELRLWPKNVDPVEINIEIFGLGRYMGKHADTKYVELPLDLIHMIADMYEISTERLIKPYIKGFLDSVDDRFRK